MRIFTSDTAYNGFSNEKYRSYGFLVKQRGVKNFTGSDVNFVNDGSNSWRKLLRDVFLRRPSAYYEESHLVNVLFPLTNLFQVLLFLLS